MLRNSTHINRHLQNAYNKYGETAFDVEVIELVMPWKLADREQYWLNKLSPYDREIGFNISRRTEAPMQGVKHSDEAREKIRTKMTGRNTKQGFKDKMRRIALDRTPAEIEKRSIAHRKTYIVTSPNGVESQIIGLEPFCSEHGLTAKKMSVVATGNRKHHRGWKCRYG